MLIIGQRRAESVLVMDFWITIWIQQFFEGSFIMVRQGHILKFDPDPAKILDSTIQNGKEKLKMRMSMGLSTL